jgi:hypothetical protein
MIQENFTSKGDMQHKLEGWKPWIQKSNSKDHQDLQGNHHLQVKTLEGLQIKRRMEKMEIEKVVASVKTKGQSQPVKTKNTTKPKNNPVPKMVQKWVPKIATPAKSVDPE